MSDLRESGAIEQDADIVMFINRPEATASEEDIKSGKVVKGAAQIIIAKHRNGSLDRIDLKFIGECTKFIDVDAQNRQDEPPIPMKNNGNFEEDEPQFDGEDDGFNNGAPPVAPPDGGGNEELPF